MGKVKVGLYFSLTIGILTKVLQLRGVIEKFVSFSDTEKSTHFK